MKTLKVILFDLGEDTVRLLKQFEQENSSLLTIAEILSDLDLISDSINLKQPNLLIVELDRLSFDSGFLNGLNVHKPKLIFLSNDKSKAYEAFKHNAIDFLLTPINPNELIVSLYKVMKYMEMESIYQNDKIDKIKIINTLQQNNDYVAIASVDKIDLLKIDEVIFCKAAGKYTEFHLENKSIVLSSRNLGEYSSLLDNNFFRIHHSYIVNIKYLTKIIKKDGLYCEFSNGHLLPVAKRRQEEFIKFIKL